MWSVACDREIVNVTGWPSTAAPSEIEMVGGGGATSLSMMVPTAVRLGPNMSYS
jgi:hypothetical protein